jgi:hypothetical protein
MLYQNFLMLLPDVSKKRIGGEAGDRWGRSGDRKAASSLNAFKDIS